MTQRAELIDLATVQARLAHICSGGGQNECLPKIAAVCAALALAAIAVAAGGRWDAVYADGGADARGKPTSPAPDESGATIQAYALRILRALSDRDSNSWVRYWQARAACDAHPDAPRVNPAPRARALTALTAAICAQLDALLGVNPADYPPRAKERRAGLLLNEPEAMRGYTLFVVEHARDVYLIDPLGRIAHAWHLPGTTPHAKLLDNGNLLAIGSIDTISEFDPRSSLVWRHRADNRIHHDFLKMPNGNVLLLVQGIKTRQEAIAAGANPEFVHENGIEYDYLAEVRPSGASGGEVVWEWSVWDHLIQDFDPTKPNYGAPAEHPELIDLNFLLESISERRPQNPQDWTHANAIDYNPALDQIMLSPRHFSELWIIDHSATTQEARGSSGGNSGMGGDLLYRWGNPRAYRHGDARDQRLFWQHQTHWIPPGIPGAGNILIFNNGNEFPGYERFYSSIDEIAPPVDGYRYRRPDAAPYPPGAPQWTYAAETPADFYAPFISGTQRLPNGDTLVVDGTTGTIFQATPDGKTTWKYIVPRHYHISLWQDAGAPPRLTYAAPRGVPSTVIRNTLYRAYWYPPDHPGLQALDLAPGAYLEDAPDLLDWARAAITAGHFGKPLARSRYDIYLDKDILIYFKQPCADEDAQAKFFLHIIPADKRVLPAPRQQYGFGNRDFNFTGNDVYALDGDCIAIRVLPRYPIARIRTGQFTDAGELWRADINLNE